MDQSTAAKRGSVLTYIGLAIMVLLTLTKLAPSLQIAGYSVFVGIAFFFIVEGVSKTPDAESGLRFKTFILDIKKPGVLLWSLLPVCSAIVTLIAGTWIFSDAFVSHLLERTSSMLSFDQVPLLIGQVVVAAFGEEIAFRGFFVGKTMNKHPFWLCALVSSVVFAAGHIASGDFGLVFFDVATIFIDSLLYAVIYRKSGNCLISAISHILCNATGMAATFLFFIK